MHQNVRLLAMHNFLQDFRLYYPVAAIYFSLVSGSYALGMSIFSITMLCAALLEVPTGIVSDLIGRKRTLVLGSVAGAAGIALYAVGGSYWMLALGAALEGLARAFFSGNNEALLHDSLAESGDEEAYQHFLGRTSAMFQVAAGIASVVGGVIAAYSFGWVMWLSVVPQLGCVAAALAFTEPKIHSEKSGNIYQHLREAVRLTVQNARLRSLSLAAMIQFAVGESAFYFRVTFIQQVWPAWAIGIARAFSHVGGAISFFYAGRVIRRFGEFPILATGLVFGAVVNIVSLALRSPLSPVLMGMTSLFFGVTMVSLSGLMQREFSQAQRATMGSLNAFGGSVMFALVSVALGALGDRVGVVPALILGEAFTLVPLLFFRAAFRASGRIQPASAAS